VNVLGSAVASVEVDFTATSLELAASVVAASVEEVDSAEAADDACS
jgi:hypothetical protein